MGSFFNRRASDKRKPYASADNPSAHMDDHPSCLAEDLMIPSYDGNDSTSVNEDISRSNADIDDIDRDEITATAHVNSPKSTASPHTSKVFAFMGASGGVGTTSLATQIAYELALKCKDKQKNIRHPKDPQVCLIDLDFEGGTCAYHLDLLPSLSVEDISGSTDRIDTTFTSALVSTHECGVSLLAVPNISGANQIINPHAVMAMLDAASLLYQYVVIDMPRYSQSWTPAVIGGADFVGIVSELTISSLHMARNTLNRIMSPFALATHEVSPNCHPILSKYERRSFKNTVRLNDAESVLDRKVLGTICIDSDTCREAINCGEPIGALRPDNRYVKDTRILIKKIFESCEANNSPHMQTENQSQNTYDFSASINAA